MEIDDDEVTIILDDDRVECSRLLLASHSEYFKAMFGGNFAESHHDEIRIQNVPNLPFRKILDIILDDLMDQIELDDIVSVLKVANMLQFSEIEKNCIEIMLHHLSPDVCLQYWFHTEKIQIMEIYPKAKLLSLLEFETVRETSQFLELEVPELKRYLGNLHLRAKEVDVFDSIVHWFRHSRLTNIEVLMDLILCVDFTSINDNELSEIIKKCKNLNYKNIYESLVIFRDVRKGVENNHFNTKYKEVAQLLTQSRNRNLDGFPHLFVFIQNFPWICALGRDLENPSLYQLPFEISSDFSGFGASSYKASIYVYGGGVIRTGKFNREINWYDTIFKTNNSMGSKINRRHFENCTVGQFICIVGGTGDYRVVEGKLDYYNMLDNRWDRFKIVLPCSGHQIKCCTLNDTALVLEMSEKIIYQFSFESRTFFPMKILDPNNVLPLYSKNLIMFSYKGYVYIKERDLIQLELRRYKWHVINKHELSDNADECTIKGTFCYDTLYIIEIRENKFSLTNNVGTYTLKTLNLNTLQLRNEYTRDATSEVEALFTAVFPDQILDEELINAALSQN